MTLKLYDHPLSPYAQKVRISLREKGLEFEAVLPGGLGAGGAAGEFIEANPRAEVPALIDGDVRIFDSTVVLEYRAAILLYLLAGVTPLLMMFIWRHLAADRPIDARDPDAFSLYFLLAFLCIQSTLAWPVWNIDYYIRTGTYAVQLLRPYDPWFTELIENIATNCLRFPINLAIVAAGLRLAARAAHAATLYMVWARRRR